MYLFYTTLKLPLWITLQLYDSIWPITHTHCIVIFSKFSHFSIFFRANIWTSTRNSFPRNGYFSLVFPKDCVWSPRTKSGPVTGLSSILYYNILCWRVQNFRNLGGANLFIFWNVVDLIYENVVHFLNSRNLEISRNSVCVQQSFNLETVS